MHEDGEDAVVTIAQASLILGVGIDTVRRLIREGHLTQVGWTVFSRYPRAFLLRRSEVERLEREGWPGRVKRRGRLGDVARS